MAPLTAHVKTMFLSCAGFLLFANWTLSSTIEVLLKDPAAASSAAAIVMGTGLPLPDGASGKPLTSSAGAVVWENYRQVNDPYGLMHAFFRQVLVPTGDLAAEVPPAYATGGIPIHDTSIGLHTAASRLMFVYGHQVTSASVANSFLIKALPEAAQAALAAVVTAGEYDAFDPALLDPASRERWQQSPTLYLRPDEASDALLLTWRAPVPMANGQARIALVDAGTGYLVGAFDPNPSDSCAPASTAWVQGSGIPQFEELGTRNSMRATPTSYFGTTYPFEAHWPKEPGVHPAIRLYHGSDGSPDDDPLGFPVYWIVPGQSNPCPPEPYYYCPVNCVAGLYKRWGMMPIRALNGSPYYEDVFGLNSSLGRQAGDAIWYSRLTFLTLVQHLNWLGYMGLRDIGFANPASVIVHQRNHPIDSASYRFVDDVIGQTDWVVVGARSQAPKPMSACLDVMAHEWGHGVIKYTAISTYDTLTRKELHEGFADVIGHIVEWDNNPGNTPGGADWVFAAHCQTSNQVREADSFHNGLCYYNGQYSGACPAQANLDPHFGGHMLSVAFRLLALDTPHHNNPAGGPYANNYVRGQGMTKARTVFFDTLNYYVTESTTWEGLPSLVGAAAAFAYPGDGALQASVICSFQAIGYASGPWFGCAGY